MYLLYHVLGGAVARRCLEKYKKEERETEQLQYFRELLPGREGQFSSNSISLVLEQLIVLQLFGEIVAV